MPRSKMEDDGKGRRGIEPSRWRGVGEVSEGLGVSGKGNQERERKARIGTSIANRSLF